MELREAIRTNGTVRTFTDDAVSPGDRAVDPRRRPVRSVRWQPSAVAGGDRRGCEHVRRSLAELMQPVWDEYLETPRGRARRPSTPSTTRRRRTSHLASRTRCSSEIDSIPVVLAVAADLRSVALMDGGLDRPPMTGGGVDLPLLLEPAAVGPSARSRRRDDDVPQPRRARRRSPARPARPPRPRRHDLPRCSEHQPTKLTRNPVESFTTIDRFDGPPA